MLLQASGVRTFWRAGAKIQRVETEEGTLACVLSSQEGSWSCFNQPRGQFSVFCQPRGHFSMHFGSQEGTLLTAMFLQQSVTNEPNTGSTVLTFGAPTLWGYRRGVQLAVIRISGSHDTLLRLNSCVLSSSHLSLPRIPFSVWTCEDFNVDLLRRIIQASAWQSISQ